MNNGTDRKKMVVDSNTKPPAQPPPTFSDTWSAFRTNIRPEEKRCMAQYFAEHDFMVPAGENGQTGSRGRAAHVLVVPGTTPNTVVEECLAWVQRSWKDGPCMITWYPLGGLIPATLLEFKSKNWQCATGANLFQIPGEVDPQSGTLTGKYTIEFLQTLKEKQSLKFNLSILSAYRFDMATGDAYFYFHNEIEPQRLAATLYAEDKFLFLDPEKFTSIGGAQGYSVEDLLKTSRSVTLYTTMPQNPDRLRFQFDKLCSRVLSPCPNPTDEQNERLKSLRLCLVNSLGEAGLDWTRQGTLAPSASGALTSTSDASQQNGPRIPPAAPVPEQAAHTSNGASKEPHG